MNPLLCHKPLPEERAIINDALMLLTPRQREAVELRSYGHTQIEIAQEMNCSQPTVSELLKNAYEQMENL